MLSFLVLMQGFLFFSHRVDNFFPCPGTIYWFFCLSWHSVGDFFACPDKVYWLFLSVLSISLCVLITSLLNDVLISLPFLVKCTDYFFASWQNVVLSFFSSGENFRNSVLFWHKSWFISLNHFKVFIYLFLRWTRKSTCCCGRLTSPRQYGCHGRSLNCRRWGSWRHAGDASTLRGTTKLKTVTLFCHHFVFI